MNSVIAVAPGVQATLLSLYKETETATWTTHRSLRFVLQKFQAALARTPSWTADECARRIPKRYVRMCMRDEKCGYEDAISSIHDAIVQCARRLYVIPQILFRESMYHAFRAEQLEALSDLIAEALQYKVGGHGDPDDTETEPEDYNEPADKPEDYTETEPDSEPEPDEGGNNEPEPADDNAPEPEPEDYNEPEPEEDEGGNNEPEPEEAGEEEEEEDNEPGPGPGSDDSPPELEEPEEQENKEGGVGGGGEHPTKPPESAAAATIKYVHIDGSSKYPLTSVGGGGGRVEVVKTETETATDQRAEARRHKALMKRLHVQLNATRLDSLF
jgi:hypothetical protein